MTDYDELRELRKSLEHGTRKERCDAAAAAGDVNDEYYSAIGDLAKALWRDESRAVRRAAAESLYKCGDVGFEMLMGMLIDNSIKIRLATRSGFGISRHPFGHDLMEIIHRDERTRKSIVEALGNFKDKRAVRAMLDMLEKENAVGKEKTHEEWSSYYDLDWWYVSEHLGRIADADINTLLDALENGCEHVQICVADALGAIENVDERVVSALIKALKFDKKNDLLSIVAQNAAKSLGKLGDRRAVPALIECVGRGCPSVEAARALGRIGDKRAVPALIEALPHESAAYALGRIGDKSAIPALKEALNQEIKWMTEAAEEDDYIHTPNWKSARALCEFGDAGLDAIVDVVRPHAPNQESFDKLAEMAKKLSSGSNDNYLSGDDAFCEITDEAPFSIYDFGPEMNPLFTYILRHINTFYSTKNYFVDLMYLSNDRDFGIILDLLEDDDVRMHSAAAMVGYSNLGYDGYIDYFDVNEPLGDGDVPCQLVEALKDDDWSAPYFVAKMFGRLEGLDNWEVGYTVELLIYMLEDPNPGVRESAARALYNLGKGLPSYIIHDRIIKALLDASEDEVVFSALAEEIDEIRYDGYSPDVVHPIIIETLPKNRNIALLCGHSDSIITDPLKELHREIWNTIMQALYDKNWYAIGALGSFVKWFSHLVCREHGCPIIRELVERLNDENAEMIDRKIAASVLGALHGGFVWQTDDIKRESDATLLALTKYASDSSNSQELIDHVVSVITDHTAEPMEQVFNNDDLRMLFREYHESERSELNERQ